MLPINHFYKLWHVIQKARKIGLFIHRKPDGDALGSSLALAYLFQELQKQFLIFSPQLIKEKMKNLSLASFFTEDLQAVMAFSPNLIIALDSSDLSISGLDLFLNNYSQKTFVANLDHHTTNTFYGNLNIIYRAASTTQIIYNFFKINHLPINKKIAESLLLGILNDTDFFKVPGVPPRTFIDAYELINYGVNLSAVKKFFLKEKTYPFLKLFGEILKQTIFLEKYNIVVVIVKEKNFLDSGISLLELEGISNFFNNLTGLKAVFLLRENLDGSIHCSMRSKDEKINVGLLAKLLGGGGHPKASGFTIRGEIVKIDKKIQIK